MSQAGNVRYIEFRIADADGNAIATRDLTSNVVGQRILKDLFRDTVVCTDPVTLVNWGSGRYYAQYTPSTAGHDYLEIYDELYDIRVIDVEDITPIPASGDSSTNDVVTLTQDYGGVGRFKVIDANPSRFVLFIYRSNDWQIGNTDPSYSVAGTTVDVLGNWTTPQITVLPDTYHVVIRDAATGEIHILAAFLEVEIV